MRVHVPEEVYGNLQQPRVTQKYSEQIRKLSCGVERFGHYLSLAMLTSILCRFSVQLASQQLEKLIESKKDPWIARQVKIQQKPIINLYVLDLGRRDEGLLR